MNINFNLCGKPLRIGCLHINDCRSRARFHHEDAVLKGHAPDRAGRRRAVLGEQRIGDRSAVDGLAVLVTGLRSVIKLQSLLARKGNGDGGG